MSLGLRLLAELPKPYLAPEELLTQVESWLLQNCAAMRPKVRRGATDSSPALFCQLHPAAEELEISLLKPTQFVVSANTTTVGPGYHIFLTSLLKDLAHNLGASWNLPAADDEDFGDETGFFFTDNEAGLRSEMVSWLEALANTFFDGSFDSDARSIALCLPWNPRFESDHPALTPLGPRDRKWLSRTAKNGHNGIDFFAWWNEGFTADYFLRRALTQMWTDVRWRNPANDSEASVLEDVAVCLKQAFELDPTLDYPWEDWRQVLAHLRRDDAEAELVNSRAEGPPIIGYRRNPVTVTLPGGWCVRIPGSFSDFESGDDGEVSAVDPPQEIWFTAFQRGNASLREFHSRKKTMAKNSSGYVIERDRYFAQATISENQSKVGNRFFILNSSNLTVGSRSVCTIVFPDLVHKESAVEMWRSIQPPEK